jgi:hypothetical protein
VRVYKVHQAQHRVVILRIQGLEAAQDEDAFVDVVVRGHRCVDRVGIGFADEHVSQPGRRLFESMGDLARQPPLHTRPPRSRRRR